LARYYRRRSSGGGFLLLIILYVYASYNDHYGVLNIATIIALALFLLFIAFVIVKNVLKIYRWFRSLFVADALSLTSADTMDGLEFERFLADMLRRLGYENVRLTERFDLGVDIVARKAGITWGIQAKRYSGLVKIAAVRQVYSALSRYGCDRGMVITNSYFSQPARILGGETGTVLVDRDSLNEWVYKANTARKGQK
jgi:HJR/Mrr/RecB family endonuclease